MWVCRGMNNVIVLVRIEYNRNQRMTEMSGIIATTYFLAANASNW